jgi:hypothetical protein
VLERTAVVGLVSAGCHLQKLARFPGWQNCGSLRRNEDHRCGACVFSFGAEVVSVSLRHGNCCKRGAVAATVYCPQKATAPAPGGAGAVPEACIFA